jgi:hypothetical protein
MDLLSNQMDLISDQIGNGDKKTDVMSQQLAMQSYQQSAQSRQIATHQEQIQQIFEFQDQITKLELAKKRAAELLAEIALKLDETKAAIREVSDEFSTQRDETKAAIREVGEAISIQRDEFRQLRDTVTAHATIDIAARATTEAAFHEVRDAVYIQRDNLKRLSDSVGAQAVLMPSWFWDPSSAERLKTILRLLRPRTVRHFSKIRLGREFDGGYIMIDDFDGVAAAVSLGINDDVSWDSEIANRKIRVYQYDHTITQLPSSHALFHFYPIKVAAADGPAVLSLNSILKARLDEGQKDIVLKIDIESDEWSVFAEADKDLLSHCRQIICEFHDLHRLAEQQFGARAEAVFQKLKKHFFVFHVHGNNCGNVSNVANIPIPDSLEVSFANRDRYEAVDTAEIFPGALDMPNQQGRADLFLGTFQF